MRLATVRASSGTRAVRIEGERHLDLGAADVSEFLGLPSWQDRAREPGDAVNVERVELLLPRPGKIVCVGLNYANHIREMGRELPEFPTLFAKYAEALVGPHDAIELAPESDAADWEAELGVVVGRRVRRASEDEAAAAVAGFTVVNDVSMRDWQSRTPQWLQGKTFERTAPVGPVLVTPDELPGGVRPRLALRAEVDGETVQEAKTDDLVFDPVTLVRYISTIVTLQPGDLIATGTPGGVGHARKPPRYLQHGSRLVTEVSDIGRLDNVVCGTGASE